MKLSILQPLFQQLFHNPVMLSHSYDCHGSFPDVPPLAVWNSLCPSGSKVFWFQPRGYTIQIKSFTSELKYSVGNFSFKIKGGWRSWDFELFQQHNAIKFMKVIYSQWMSCDRFCLIHFLLHFYDICVNKPQFMTLTFACFSFGGLHESKEDFCLNHYK